MTRTPEGSSSTRAEIRAGLEPMFERALRENLWFYSSYQNLWFTPAELRAQQEMGRFMWGAANWKLRSPQELLGEVEEEISEARERLETIRSRMQSTPKQGATHMATSISAGDKVMYTLESGQARVAEVTFITVAPTGTRLNLVVTLDPLDDPNGGKLHLGVVEAKQGEPGEAKKWYPMS